MRIGLPQRQDKRPELRDMLGPRLFLPRACLTPSHARRRGYTARRNPFRRSSTILCMLRSGAAARIRGGVEGGLWRGRADDKRHHL